MGLFGPNKSLSDILGGDEPQEPPDVRPTYYSTGPGGIELDSSWRRFEFDFVARSVSVRSTDPNEPEPVLIAFDKPFGEPSRHIHIDVEELPFSMGGETPINTGIMWAKKSPQATSNPSVEVVAMHESP